MTKLWSWMFLLATMLNCSLAISADDVVVKPIKPKRDSVVPPSPDRGEHADKSSDQDAAHSDTNDTLINVMPPIAGQMVIDLCTALRLAESQNPKIGLAREVVNEAIARRKEARAMLLPTLTAGTNYRLHTGVLQTALGSITAMNLQSVYAGSGVGAIGSNTVAIPGVRIFAQTSDAYYQPLAAQQTVAARTFDSLAVNNLTLLDVADRYLDLVAAEARREALAVSFVELKQIEVAQKAFARVGQGRDADYHRARANLLLLSLEEQQAQEQAAAASIELGRQLQLDPSVQLITPAGPIELLEFITEPVDTEFLVDEALRHRPEVVSRSAEIGAAEYRLQNERMRPWLPQISVGFSGGAFGGGSNRQDLGTPSFYQGTYGRTDLDVWAVWTAQNLGTGNQAWQGMRRAERDQAIFQRALAVAQIRNEVTDRLAQTRAKRRTVDVSWAQLSAAERGADEEIRLTRSGEALPLEALNSVLRLSTARQQLLAAVIDYNRAQLRLFVALGTNLNDCNP